MQWTSRVCRSRATGRLRTRTRVRVDRIGIEGELRALQQNVSQSWSGLISARANIISSEEGVRAARLAAALGNAATVWPALDLGQLTDRMAGGAGVIGVDSGLSHIATALDLPHVQIYNFDTAWRTGPAPGSLQCSVLGTPSPTVDQVWQAWKAVRPGAVLT